MSRDLDTVLNTPPWCLYGNLTIVEEIISFFEENQDKAFTRVEFRRDVGISEEKLQNAPIKNILGELRADRIIGSRGPYLYAIDIERGREVLEENKQTQSVAP